MALLKMASVFASLSDVSLDISAIKALNSRNESTPSPFASCRWKSFSIVVISDVVCAGEFRTSFLARFKTSGTFC